MCLMFICFLKTCTIETRSSTQNQGTKIFNYSELGQFVAGDNGFLIMLVGRLELQQRVDEEEGQKKQRLAAEGLDPEGQRVAQAGRARSGLGGASWGTWKHLALLR